MIVLRDKHFMIDIEATGVDLKKDALLEIGIVEMLPFSTAFSKFNCSTA